MSAESVQRRWRHASKLGEFTLFPSDRGLIDPSFVIFRLVSSNPKSKRPAERFALYENGMTVDRYVSLVEKLGEPRRVAMEDICWDINHEFIELRAFGRPWSPARAKAQKLEFSDAAKQSDPCKGIAGEFRTGRFSTCRFCLVRRGGQSQTF